MDKQSILEKFIDHISTTESAKLAKLTQYKNIGTADSPTIDLIGLQHNVILVRDNFPLIERFVCWLKHNELIRISPDAISENLYGYTDKGREQLNRKNLSGTIQYFCKRDNCDN